MIKGLLLPRKDRKEEWYIEVRDLADTIYFYLTKLKPLGSDTPILLFILNKTSGKFRLSSLPEDVKGIIKTCHHPKGYRVVYFEGACGGFGNE